MVNQRRRIKGSFYERMELNQYPFDTQVGTHNNSYLLPPATKLGQGNIFRSVCQQFCPWGGACMVAQGGMHGFIRGGVHGFIRGGMRGFIRGGHAWFYLGGHVWFYSVGGHAWFYSVGGCAWFYSVGGMRGFIQRGGMSGFIQWGGMRGFIQQGGVVLFRGGVRGFFSFSGYNEIRSMSGRYASYWNAFLFKLNFTSD